MIDDASRQINRVDRKFDVIRRLAVETSPRPVLQSRLRSALAPTGRRFLLRFTLPMVRQSAGQSPGASTTCCPDTTRLDVFQGPPSCQSASKRAKSPCRRSARQAKSLPMLIFVSVREAPMKSVIAPALLSSIRHNQQFRGDQSSRTGLFLRHVSADFDHVAGFQEIRWNARRRWRKPTTE